MADEQTPQSDLIDDAIRQAERQLEEKLEALRLSALGEPTPPSAGPSSDVAVLRPTAGAQRADAQEAPAPAASDAQEAWHETPGSDVRFAPSGGSASLSRTELYVPDEQDHAPAAPRPADTAWEDIDDAPEMYATSSASVASTDVRDLVAVWDEPEDRDVSSSTVPAGPAPWQESVQQPTVASEPVPSRPVPHGPQDTSEASGWEEPEPVHSSWTSSGETRPSEVAPAPAPAPAPAAPTLPSEEELQFWAHTRTALRNLQQVTETIPGTVATDVTENLERVVRDELAPTGATLRLVQQQLQQGLPQLAERLEEALDQALSAPDANIRQLREELPSQLDRAVRDTRTGLRDDLDNTAATIHGAVQQDVARLEESIASNVTRMAQGTSDSVARVERDLELLGASVARFERGVGSEFERVEQGMRESIQQVETSLREQLAGPAETVRKLDLELPTRFGQVERVVVDQLQTTQRDLSSVLVSLVDANRASLDRVASIASTLDEDRARRAEDVELMVDTVTTGWEGLASAMKALFEQHEETSRRVNGIEQRLGELRDLEGAVEATMAELRDHIRDLQPAPVIVTVAHPEAEVRNTARGGWVAGETQT